MKKVIACVFALILLLSCSWMNNIPINETTKVATPSNSNLLPFSSTYTFTGGPTSSSTFTPSPTKLCPPQPNGVDEIALGLANIQSFLPNSNVVWYETYRCNDYSYGWWSPNTNPATLISIQNGILNIQANPFNSIIASLIRGSYDIHDGQGIVALFRYREGSSVSIFIDSGVWLDASYRGWGLTINVGDDHLNNWFGWKGKNLSNYDFPTNILRPNTWYYLLIRLGEEGDVTMKVVEKDRQEIYATYHINPSEKWVNKNWKAVFQVTSGVLEVDEYWQLLFTEP